MPVASDRAAVAKLSCGKPLVAELTRLGFKYVTLDLAGYQSGSQNRVLPASAQLVELRRASRRSTPLRRPPQGRAAEAISPLRRLYRPFFEPPSPTPFMANWPGVPPNALANACSKGVPECTAVSSVLKRALLPISTRTKA